jgi:hypothetical protein
VRRLIGVSFFLSGVVVSWCFTAWEWLPWLFRGLFQAILGIIAFFGLSHGPDQSAWLPCAVTGCDAKAAAPFVSRDFAVVFADLLKVRHDVDRPWWRWWQQSYFGPEAIVYREQPYWVIVRTTTDSSIYVDANNNEAQQVCQHLHAAPAIIKDGKYLRPSPGGIIHSVTWPEVITRCEVKGGDTTYEFPTLHEHGTVLGGTTPYYSPVPLRPSGGELAATSIR